MTGNILVVEDEVDIQEIVSYNLEKAGFGVVAVDSGETALESIRKRIPDLVVLDLMLPGMDGLEVCRLLKQDATTRDLPILMLTARAEEVDRVVGLELGADDYVVKPFSARELTLRVQAILRRLAEGRDPSAAESDPEAMRFGSLTIDKAAHRVTVDNDVLALTSTEFSLLATLADRRGRVQTREELLNTVWGYDYAGYGRTVDTHIRRLREKLGDASEMVETVRGVGYRFTPRRQ
ncbi:MAG: response regulator transcription factor [Gemmatimonadota bacterium]|nr:response regulator transcription factor [Gemmatimonadota bacterium]